MKTLIKFIPFAFVISCALGLVLFEVHQNYRQNANDPQIQIAEDLANLVQSGQNTDNLNLPDRIDITQSLATFVVVYDTDHTPVAGSGYLNANSPIPPAGTFRDTENRFTWEPSNDVRIATVLVPIDKGNKGYVLAGRSLREVEIRENNLTITIVLAWFAAMVGTFAILWVINRISKE